MAQLGGVHLACEGVSNVLTKLLEWGRLMAYLEQSTRYVPYADRPGGRFRYHVPAEVRGSPIEREFEATLDLAFETYARWLEPMQEHFRRRHPRQPSDSEVVYRNTIRAKALDTLRGLLPAATRSNLGLYGTGQAYEALLLRLRASPLAEARACADLMLTELRKVIPAFLRRVDAPERGGAWSAYLAATREATEAVAARVLGSVAAEPRPEVVLADFDPEGEVKIVAAALYAASGLPDDQLLARARRMTVEERAAVLRAYVGERGNRRHKPGRAFERTSYRFDVLTDYGAFRDLQRHRLLSLEWQPLGPRHGYAIPEAVEEAGGGGDWRRVMEASAALHDLIVLSAARPRGAVLRVHGVSHPLLHGDERSRGDARAGASDGAPGPPRVPARVPGDAPSDRRAAPATARWRRRCASSTTRPSSWSGSRPSAAPTFAGAHSRSRVPIVPERAAAGLGDSAGWAEDQVKRGAASQASDSSLCTRSSYPICRNRSAWEPNCP